MWKSTASSPIPAGLDAIAAADPDFRAEVVELAQIDDQMVVERNESQCGVEGVDVVAQNRAFAAKLRDFRMVGKV